MNVIVHPLALLGVSDSVYRQSLQASHLLTYGFFLGVVNDGVCSVAMAFEPTDDLAQRLETLAHIYPFLQLVGYYSMGQLPSDTLATLKQSTPASRAASHLVYSTFAADMSYKFYDFDTGDELATAIGTTPMENITVEEIIQAEEPLEDGRVGKNLLDDTAEGVESSLNQLAQRLSSIIAYLESVDSGATCIYGESDANYVFVREICRLAATIDTIRKCKEADQDDDKLLELALVNQALLLSNSKKRSELADRI